jgi:hypothetical protein
MSAMQPTRLTTKLTAGALTMALGAAVLVWPVVARAEEDVPLDTRVFRGILESFGLRKDGEDIINYQERAPLVIPPARTLPPPEKSSAVVEKNPAWPVDPDVKRAKDDAARERKKSINADAALQDQQRVLRQDEMTPGGKPHDVARRADPDAYQAPATGYGNALSPSELGTKGNLFTNMFKKDEGETARFIREPPRASLTAPPPGYQTPSPDQPYGIGKEVVVPKQSDYLTDHPVGTQ